jgi:hypothetical protein
MTKISNYIILSILSFSLGLNSCINCIDGNGTFASEDRSNGLKSFKHIDLDGSFDLVITQDTIQQVFIEGDENVISHIETRVSSDRLIIQTESNRCYNSEHKLKVRASVISLEDVNVDGSGNISCNGLTTSLLNIGIKGSGDADFSNLNTESANVNIDGSGNVFLNGTATQTSFSIEGSGEIKASDFIQENCKVNIGGSGTIYTNFSESLTGSINGSGTIYYKGSKANVRVNINGSGSVINNN